MAKMTTERLWAIGAKEIEKLDERETDWLKFQAVYDLARIENDIPTYENLKEAKEVLDKYYDLCKAFDEYRDRYITLDHNLRKNYGCSIDWINNKRARICKLNSNSETRFSEVIRQYDCEGELSVPEKMALEEVQKDAIEKLDFYGIIHSAKEVDASDAMRILQEFNHICDMSNKYENMEEDLNSILKDKYENYFIDYYNGMPSIVNEYHTGLDLRHIYNTEISEEGQHLYDEYYNSLRIEQFEYKKMDLEHQHYLGKYYQFEKEIVYKNALREEAVHELAERETRITDGLDLENARSIMDRFYNLCKIEKKLESMQLSGDVESKKYQELEDISDYGYWDIDCDLRSNYNAYLKKDENNKLTICDLNTHNNIGLVHNYSEEAEKELERRENMDPKHWFDDAMEKGIKAPYVEYALEENEHDR